MKDLVKIQNELKVPKGNYNSFGKYKYRSSEDILEAVKPILLKYNVTLRLTDEIILIGNKYFLKATATIWYHDTDKRYNESFGYAELSEHKGMSSEQCTGTASSYARKYALNGLFLIDETEADADSQKPKEDKKPLLTPDKFDAMVKAINEGKKLTVEVAMDNYTISPEHLTALKTALKNN